MKNLMMSSEHSFSTLLINELKKFDLLPSRYEFTAVHHSVLSKGQEELTRFRRAVGNVTWWKGFVTTRQWHFSYFPVAGWGFYLSSYVNAPLQLSRSENEIVGHLGALSSVIVTLYDGFLDKRLFAYPPLPPHWLSDILQNDPVVETTDQQNAPSSTKLLSGLIELFLNNIYKLPYVEQRPNVLALLKNSIRKMYEAENKTAMYAPQKVSKYILVRKSAFPFVIMGLIGWLTSASVDQSLYGWHLHWLYKLGSFFSLIDDAVDIHLDRLNGHPNLFIHHINMDSFSQSAWARKVALKGKLLHNEWHQRVYPNSPLPFNVSMVLTSCLASWLM